MTNLMWNSEHKKTYQALFNKLIVCNPTLIIDNYLIQINKIELIKIIHNFDLSDGRKESYFFMVARYLAINEPNDNFIKHYQQEGYNLKTKREHKFAETKLDDKEEFKDYNYFIDILKNINEEDIKDIKHHYGYLILSLLIFQKSVKTDFYLSATFSTNEEYDKNYIWLTNNRVYYIVNKDNFNNNKKETGLIEIKNKELVKILYDSFEKYPRKYLFESATGCKINNQTLRNYLKTITNLPNINLKTIKKIPNINFHIIRSIYITHFYENNKSLKIREQLAKNMSVPTVCSSYLKNVDQKLNEENKQIETLKEVNIKLQIEINNLKQKLNELHPDKKVTANTQEVKNIRSSIEDNNPVKAFINEFYHITNYEKNKIRQNNLYEHFLSKNKYKTNRTFCSDMRFNNFNMIKSNGVKYWQGLIKKSDEEPDNEE